MPDRRGPALDPGRPGAESTGPKPPALVNTAVDAGI